MAKIKIVDDDLELAENLGICLKEAGHTVDCSDQIESIVDDLIADRPDILILDVMFPENPAAGFDAARKLHHRRETRDIPVVLLTGINQEFPMEFSSDDIDAEWMPVREFVEKPVSPPELLEKINKLLNVSSE